MPNADLPIVLGTDRPIDKARADVFPGLPRRDCDLERAEFSFDRAGSGAAGIPIASEVSPGAGDHRGGHARAGLCRPADEIHAGTGPSIPVHRGVVDAIRSDLRCAPGAPLIPRGGLGGPAFPWIDA